MKRVLRQSVTAAADDAGNEALDNAISVLKDDLIMQFQD